jgi:uncharacterized protein YkwD
MKLASLLALGTAAALFLGLSWPLMASVPPPRPTGLQVGGFPGGRIRLSWRDNAPNETEFRLERSKDRRDNYTLLAMLPANTTLYTDTTVLLDTTYWYRVRACNGQGCSSPSKDSYNVSFAIDALPNLDERYMLFLVNEVRASLAAYGLEARPPLVSNPLLSYAAHAHAQAVLNSNFSLPHCYPTPNDPATEYRCPTERARDVGYNCLVSENMISGGEGWQAVEAAHQAFVASGDHLKNLLDFNAKEAGMGHAYNLAQGAAGSGQYVQTFCGQNSPPPQALPAGLVVPYWGRASTAFTFLVNFYNPAGTAPKEAQVVIDGQAYPMKLRRGKVGNGSYAYTTALSPGSHTYYFSFGYGENQRARLPLSGIYHGPEVEMGQAVLEVPGEYPTLAKALASAKGEVIIQLAAGTLSENTPLTLSLPGIELRGAGMDRTLIRGPAKGHLFQIVAPAVIQDLTLAGSGSQGFDSALWHTQGQLRLHHVRVTGNNRGLFTYCFSPDCQATAIVTNSIFDHNSGAAIEANAYGLHYLINTTIVANGEGVILNNNQSEVENNIIVSNKGAGLAGPAITFPKVRYNNVWGNERNYKELKPGPGQLSLPPQFEAEDNGDYRLQVISPCLDAGQPAAKYDDRNGSRNDLGAYGGPLAPVSLNSRVSVTPTGETAYLVSWQGYATDGLQSYDIQYRLGYNGMWRDWLTNITTTSARFGPTRPIEVSASSVYYFRSRVRDTLGNVEAYPRQADAYTGLEIMTVYLPLLQKGTH